MPLACKETLPKHCQDRKKDISRTEYVTHLGLKLTQHHSLDEGDKELSARQWFLPNWKSSIEWVFVSPSHWARAMRPAPGNLSMRLSRECRAPQGQNQAIKA